MSSPRNDSDAIKRAKSDDPLQSPATIAQRVAVLVARILADGMRPEQLSVDDPLADLGIGSLKLVNLMLGTETEFDIVIPQADIKLENFQSIAAIVALVSRLDVAH